MILIFIYKLDQKLGAKLHRALENGVSKYPDHEGRFLQVSGIQYSFDPSKPPGNRVDPELIQVHDEYLDLDKVFVQYLKY